MSEDHASLYLQCSVLNKKKIFLTRVKQLTLIHRNPKTEATTIKKLVKIIINYNSGGGIPRGAVSPPQIHL